MRVFVRPSDFGPCAYYRLIWPGRAVKGHEVRIPKWVYVGDVAQARAEVVVIQRPLDARVSRLVRQMRTRGTAVVVDVDDDLGSVHKKNPAYQQASTNHHNVVEACEAATLVTVTTPALAERYAPHGRVKVIPNFVPAAYLDTPHMDSAVVGWGGNLGVHPENFQVLGDTIKNLVKYGAEVQVVGPRPRVGFKALGLNARTGGRIVSLADWPQALSAIGIGIAPLADTPFNRAKSRLRPLQYSAVGIPWIASPLPDYTALHDEGAGLLASSPAEWEALLLELIENPDKRAELADAGKEVALFNTIEGNAHLWEEAWQIAYDTERT